MNPQYLGLLGDALTFTGGMILAVDAIKREKEFREINNLKELVTKLAGVQVAVDGKVLADENSVDLNFIRKSVARAKWGSLLVAMGFVLLLIVRILEIRGPQPA